MLRSNPCTRPDRRITTGLLLLALQAPEHASASPGLPLASVVERLGQPLDPNLAFSDERGTAVRLGSFFGGARPLLVTLNYFRCHMLCDLQLQRLTQSLAALDDLRGSDFRVLTVSIDPTDRPADAASRRHGYLRRLGRAEVDWRFLVGHEPRFVRSRTQLGFGYRYDPSSQQYAHAPMAFVIAPGGRIVRYLYGIDYPPSDLRHALIEASQGRIGSTLDKVLLRCFEFDPAAGRYGLYVLGLVRAGGVLTVLAMVLGFAWLRRMEARRGG